MNYNERKEIDELIAKFNTIRKKGYIKGINNGISSMGLTFEREMGIERNDFNGPDFKGIELKTRLGYTVMPIGLFTMAPSNDENEIKRLVETYGTNNKYGGKNLNVKVNALNKTNNNDYQFKLETDFAEGKIWLSIYKNEKFIEKKIYWDYYTLWSIIIQKLNCLAIIKVWPSSRKGEKYFKYYMLHVYYLYLKADIYKLIENGTISLKIDIGSYTKGKKIGQIHYHGCIFSIEEDRLNELFIKLF